MSDGNPFQAPASDQLQYDETPQDAMVVATQGKRFVNFLIDQVLLRVFMFGGGIMFGLIAVQTDMDEPTFNLLALALGAAIFLLYYIIFEFLFGKTLAKFITGTRVVRADGQPPTMGQIIGRTLCRLIPFEPFSFFGGHGRPVGWHDSLSGTRVIVDR